MPRAFGQVYILGTIESYHLTPTLFVTFFTIKDPDWSRALCSV